MKDFVWLGFLVVAAVGHFGVQGAESPPNIVFILADDLGWSDLGCYGSALHETPRLDQLAAEGVRFTHAYAAAALCSPTRASILTGRSPARLHLTDFIAGRRYPHAKLLPPLWTKQLKLEEQTLAEVLKEQGYATAMIGKWHLGGHEFSPERQGFETNIGGTHLGFPPSYFSPYENPKLPDGPDGEHLPLRLSLEAAKFISEHRDRPFFVYLSFFSVHVPIQADADTIARYEARLRRRPAKEGEHDNANYAAMVESLDTGVGTVLDRLDQCGLRDNTIVVFFSDNGGLCTLEGPHTPATTNHPLRMGKGFLYEGGIREPLIVRWPQHAAVGAVCQTPIISDDFFPTLAEAVGLDVQRVSTNGPIDGVSFLELLEIPDRPASNRALFWHYPHYPKQGSKPAGAVRLGDHKLIENFEDGSVELYNLRDDMGERNNLATERPEVAKRMLQLLYDWRTRVDAQMPRPNPDYDAEDPMRDAYWMPNTR